jgi:hypothetical protein
MIYIQIGFIRFYIRIIRVAYFIRSGSQKYCGGKTKKASFTMPSIFIEFYHKIIQPVRLQTSIILKPPISIGG